MTTGKRFRLCLAAGCLNVLFGARTRTSRENKPWRRDICSAARYAWSRRSAPRRERFCPPSLAGELASAGGSTTAVWRAPAATAEISCKRQFLFHRTTARSVSRERCCKRINGQASRQISIGQLHASRRVHTRPIDLVIFQEPLGILRSREISSCGGFHA